MGPSVKKAALLLLLQRADWPHNQGVARPDLLGRVSRLFKRHFNLITIWQLLVFGRRRCVCDDRDAAVQSAPIPTYTISPRLSLPIRI